MIVDGDPALLSALQRDPTVAWIRPALPIDSAGKAEERSIDEARAARYPSNAARHATTCSRVPASRPRQASA
jgi:hypothetical protein